MSHWFRRAIVLAAIFPAFALAQTARVPAAYQDLYAVLKGQLDGFYSTVSGNWDGSQPAVDFAGELLTANSNRGEQLLTSSANDGVLLELHQLKARGVKAVTVQIAFPILSTSFLSFNGTPNDYQAFLSFYQLVMSESRSLGLKVVVESGVMFPGVFSAGSGLNVAGYYPTLNGNDYINGRAAMAALIAQQLHPDYLSVGSEPDTEAQLTGQAQISSPSGFALLINTIVAAINGAGVTGIPLGAGVGTWLSGAPDYIRSLASTNINYIDLHIYPVNQGFLNNAIALTDLAHSLGKEVGMSEAWLLKERDSEFSTSNVASNPEIFSRDAFSFWQPLDQEFLAGLTRFAYWKNLNFVSAFWTKYFWAYLDYNQVANMTADEITAASGQASATALVNGSVTNTGGLFQDALAVSGPPATAVSGASFTPFALAPGSIVTLFGGNLSTGAPIEAPSLPLPTELGGSSVSITDSTGAVHNASFFFSSSLQLNVLIPTNLLAGPGVLTVRHSGQTVAESVVTISAIQPGLFSANASGSGVGAVATISVGNNGTQTFSIPVKCGGAAGCVAVPIDVLTPKRVVLELFGTGVAGQSGGDSVTVLFNGVAVTPDYAGLQGHFVGLDQINVGIPRSLAGAGLVNVQVVVDGVTSNTVLIDVR